MTDDERIDAAFTEFAEMGWDERTVKIALRRMLIQTRARALGAALGVKRRYTCKLMRGVCQAIADQIKRDDGE